MQIFNDNHVLVVNFHGIFLVAYSSSNGKFSYSNSQIPWKMVLGFASVLLLATTVSLDKCTIAWGWSSIIYRCSLAFIRWIFYIPLWICQKGTSSRITFQILQDLISSFHVLLRWWIFLLLIKIFICEVLISLFVNQASIRVLSQFKFGSTGVFNGSHCSMPVITSLVHSSFETLESLACSLRLPCQENTLVVWSLSSQTQLLVFSLIFPSHHCQLQSKLYQYR